MANIVNKPSEAVLIHQAAIGDFLVASRLIGVCDEIFGPFRWSYLGKPAHGKLGKALGLFEAFEDFDRVGWHLLFTEDQPIPEPMEKYLQSFSLIVNLASGPETIFARRLEESANGKAIHIDVRLPADYPDHVFQYLARQIPGFSGNKLPSTAYTVDADILKQVRAKIEPGEWTLIHPGASSGAKRRPTDEFDKLAETLTAAGERVGFLIGQVEMEYFLSGEMKSFERFGPLFVDWPLEKLAGLLAFARRYIGNDNGISHLSAVVGAETTVAFVQPISHQWRPIGPRVRVISPGQDIDHGSLS